MNIIAFLFFFFPFFLFSFLLLLTCFNLFHYAFYFFLILFILLKFLVFLWKKKEKEESMVSSSKKICVDPHLHIYFYHIMITIPLSEPQLYTLQVRSLTLDVKVWEPTILDLFGSLGNAYCNSIWEGLLLLKDQE